MSEDTPDPRWCDVCNRNSEQLEEENLSVSDYKRNGMMVLVCEECEDQFRDE